MFVPLRVHSVYSKGKGGATLQELASWASQRNCPSLALSDRENIYGWGKWKRKTLECGVHPIFGCEIDLQGRTFLFLVKNREGYWNLMEILNRKKLKTTEGLVVVLIPRSGEEAFPESLIDLAGEDFYLGGDFFNLEKALFWASQHSVPSVWANPLKFIKNPERLILLHSIQKKIPFPPERERLKHRMKFFGPDQEALALKKFGSRAKAFFTKSAEVAEKCQFSFEGIVPSLPEDLFSTTLRNVVMDRLRTMKNLSWRERQRARRELDVVEQSGFAPYFLVVHDVVEFARHREILHNLKGSGASSFLAYLLGISRVSPIEFDLYFERFLNKGRNDPPDFDLDFDSRKRDEVLSYVLEKYGKGQTGAAFVCSLKNYRARSALYETARAFGLPPAESRSLSQRAPFFAEPDFLKKDKPPPGTMEIWKAASDLTSVYCENSLHVGGVILTLSPVDRYLPLTESAKGYVMSHFDRDAVEDLKLIKLDLLSVRGLAAVSATKKILKIKSIPPRDRKTFSLLRDAERNREGRSAFRDPFMTRILPETGGLLLYEEQVMQVAERVAGMPPEEGDLLRRSLKKKIPDPPMKAQFFRETGERGYTTAEIEKLWKVMKEFSSYSFNKAHSASYAHMAYQAVYLKAHYPVPYLTSVLNAGGGYYGLAEYIEEAKRQGIRVLGPDVNRSDFQFEVEGKSIRVGLMSIKGLALKTAEKIITEREKGSYVSIEDFLFRVSLTKAALFTFIKAGVFDSLEPRRIQQILRYFRGIEGMGKVMDLDQKQKERMLIESLGFDPEGDSLSLFKGKRPALRVENVKDYVGHTVDLVLRVVDARRKGVNSGQKYFFLFEDETGLLEGVGETKCLTFDSPPTCYLRGEVRSDRTGRPKIFNCTFLKPF
jgi:DNA polymerase III alpha subunit